MSIRTRLIFIAIAAFFILPVMQLALVSASGPEGLAAYASIVTKPRHLESMIHLADTRPHLRGSV